MLTIQLPKRKLELPESWEELRPDHVPVVFRYLMQLFSNEITPLECQFKLMVLFTGYRPTRRLSLLSLIRKIISKNEKYIDFVNDENETIEIIEFNLIQLSEKINFAFTVEANKIVPNYEFKRNPFGVDAPVYFNRDVTVETNITAKQYTDCLDLLSAFHASTDAHVHEVCLLKIMSTLYQIEDSEARKYPIEVLFGVMFWFTGIVKFFREHSVYGILYDRKSNADEDITKINLGMGEVLLYLEKEGYSFMDQKNIIDFYNAQIKALKDSVNSALSMEVKIEDIAKRTGLSINTINRLSNE